MGEAGDVNENGLEATLRLERNALHIGTFVEKETTEWFDEHGVKRTWTVTPVSHAESVHAARLEIRGCPQVAARCVGVSNDDGPAAAGDAHRR